MACITPVSILNPRFDVHPNEQRTIAVPCGRCSECLRSRVASWRFRISVEERFWKNVDFITLTYNTDHVPITQNGFMSLKYSDVQLFWKRLRKRTGVKLRYYLAGEYGGLRGRPHYHAIVFGVQDKDAYALAWRDDLDHPIGNVFLGDTKRGSVQYVLDYVNKPRVVPAHARDDRMREFSRMSKGLGKRYLSPEMLKWHLDDVERSYVVLEGGVKQALPRYYKKLIAKDHPEHVAKMQRIAAVKASETVISDDLRNVKIARFKRASVLKPRRDL